MNRIDAVSRVPIAAHAEIVAAGVVIEIVVEAAQLAILKAHSGKASTARNRRSHHFRNDADAPFFVAQMIDFVADAQIEPLTFTQVARFFDAAIKMLERQRDVRG